MAQNCALPTWKAVGRKQHGQLMLDILVDTLWVWKVEARQVGQKQRHFSDESIFESESRLNTFQHSVPRRRRSFRGRLLKKPAELLDSRSSRIEVSFASGKTTSCPCHTCLWKSRFFAASDSPRRLPMIWRHKHPRRPSRARPHG